MASSPSTTLHLADHALTLVPERDALAHALEGSEERFHRLAERIAVGVFRVSRNGRFVEVNPALLRMLGYADEHELFGVDIARAVFADEPESERILLRTARGPMDRSATRWKRKDGTEFSVRLSMRAVLDEDGCIGFYDGIVEAVSEAARQQERLRRTERMAGLGATLAGVAHELNNPLAAILGFAQLLLKKDMDSEARLGVRSEEAT